MASDFQELKQTVYTLNQLDNEKNVEMRACIDACAIVDKPIDVGRCISGNKGVFPISSKIGVHHYFRKGTQRQGQQPLGEYNRTGLGNQERDNH